jgi:hypothetical protein
MIAALLSALLTLFPASPSRSCIEARAAQITADVGAAARRHGVPPALLLAVGFVETHLGCDRASGGCWGAPISPERRGTAGTVDHAARALASGYAACGSWPGAVCRFRCGLCRCPPRHERYQRVALSLAARLTRAAAP